MNPENFLIERHENILILKINRPKALNALNSAVLKEFLTLLNWIDAQNELRVVILTGAGEKAFIAGADIAQMAKFSKKEALEFAELGQSVTEKIEALSVPVIAAVNGFALGGGCEMAIACDFILASSTAIFGQPEVALGLITGFGGAVRLAHFVGCPMARELIFSGRRIRADEALRIGLANRVVAPENLLEEALLVAKEIVANSPRAVSKVKFAMQEIRSRVTVRDQLAVEAKAFSEVFETKDQIEGTSAFLEKRKPTFAIEG